MPIPPATRLGPYEILSPIGAGGMGEVYRAKDTRLDRIVAVKILPEHLSQKPGLRQRFEREARAISSLNHPHICTVHDIGHQDGIDYVVMEYLEGETLAHRLKKGTLPLDQVLRHAIEMADALDQAHRKGVIHRDLKPGNIMLTKTGVKLLDFGLAKILDPKPRSTLANLTALPTHTTPLTSEGAIIGTLQYMAPEQLEGAEADARTDIFAFGAVIYETLTGRKAFEAKSQASLIAAILDSEPSPISTLQPVTPAALDRAVSKCMAKDPERRWQTVADLKDELMWIEGGIKQKDPAIATVVQPSRFRDLRARLGWIVALLCVFAIPFSIALFRTGTQEVPVLRFTVPEPGKGSFAPGAPSLSPDGRRLAFVAPDSSGKEMLWIRLLDALSARPLVGTEGASYPFWSPDSRSLGFFAAGKLKRIDVSGGVPQTLCDVLLGWGGTWNRDGDIVFAPSNRGPLYRISAVGGTATPLTKLDERRGDGSHNWPQFLPDGRHFLYLVRSGKPETTGVYVGSLDATAAKLVVTTGFGAIYARLPGADSGYLLFLRGGALTAQRFDPKNLTTLGDAVLVEPVFMSFLGVGGPAAFSASENGILAYRSVDLTKTMLVWVDRKGKPLGSISAPGIFDHPELSPDEKLVAVDRGDPQSGTRDIWLIDLDRHTTSRLTFDPASAWVPVWAPDGDRVAFISERDGISNLYQKSSNGVGGDEILLKSGTSKHHSHWSPDGRYIVYENENPKTKSRSHFEKYDIWVAPLFGDRKPFPFVQTEFAQYFPRFSPDGKWLAYVSDESGEFEVYVQSFPDSRLKKQISTNGGSQPRWRGDGKELFYIEDRKLMAVAIKPGPKFEADVPKALFETGMSAITDPRNQYTVAADGQRFLLNAPVEETASSPITIVLNWTAGLNR